MKVTHVGACNLFSDLTIQYGENQVNAKEALEMTQEELTGLEDLDDAFVLAQAEKTTADDLIKALDES